MKTRRNLARVLAVLLALAMLMCAVGCSKGENTTGDDTQSTSNNTSGNATTTAPSDGTTGGDNTNTTAPEDDEPEIYVLSGVWKFHEELSVPDEIPEETKLKYSFVFSIVTDYESNGEVFSEYMCFSGGLAEDWLLLHYSSTSVYYSASGGWKNEAYRTVDLGEYPQEVTEYCYKWFVANADKISD